MNKIFKVNLRDDNGYVVEFNTAMRYMLEQLPEIEIISETDGELLIKSLSDKSADLLGWLYEIDGLVITREGDA